jgi:hypothetical protein
MKKDIKIRNGNASDLGDIMSISKSLDKWFNEDGIKYCGYALDSSAYHILCNQV